MDLNIPFKKSQSLSSYSNQYGGSKKGHLRLYRPDIWPMGLFEGQCHGAYIWFRWDI